MPAEFGVEHDRLTVAHHAAGALDRGSHVVERLVKRAAPHRHAGWVGLDGVADGHDAGVANGEAVDHLGNPSHPAGALQRLGLEFGSRNHARKRDLAIPGLDLDARGRQSGVIAERPATASAVAWLALVFWARAGAEAPASMRPRAVEIHFFTAFMILSFSRRSPTRPSGRRAGHAAPGRRTL